MRIAHRIPAPSWFAAPESDPVDEDYEADVTRMTDKAEREHKRLQDRVARAEKQLSREQARKTTSVQKQRIRQLQAAVTGRRAELAEYERLMMTPVTEDKQIRLRTGLDDHLELGVHKHPHRDRPPNGPVIARMKERGEL
jgi:hypothetical protein